MSLEMQAETRFIVVKDFMRNNTDYGNSVVAGNCGFRVKELSDVLGLSGKPQP